MKSNFVATISHEFRTPLTSIKAYCETLLKNAESIDRQILKEFLVVIDEESNRLMALIEDILDSLGATPEQIDRERARAHADLSGAPRDGDGRAMPDRNPWSRTRFHPPAEQSALQPEGREGEARTNSADI